MFGVNMVEKWNFGSEVKNYDLTLLDFEVEFWSRMWLFFVANVVLVWPHTFGVSTVENWNFD